MKTANLCIYPELLATAPADACSDLLHVTTRGCSFVLHVPCSTTVYVASVDYKSSEFPLQLNSIIHLNKLTA